ncbi:HEPN domain-containing protein [Halosolutus halophilus]|uniref:HEPN domain-containing protein n=1 Tax=Halosolutus halophilus TaxID=1552990 RepID=UPI0022352B64|nr:HEPN domain-containing protein [Halosolutus halophilus]
MDPNIKYARRQISKAENKLDYCKEIWVIEREEIEDEIEDDTSVALKVLARGFIEAGKKFQIADVVIDSQFCIEQSAKAIFKLEDKDPPGTHAIELDDDRAIGLLNELPDELDITEDVKRVIFLTKVWKPYYEVAKYGYPKANVPSHSFMEAEDADRAISDAEFCLETAQKLLDYYN